MLDSQVVRVGFVTQLNWARYGGFWVALAGAAGLDAVFADPELVKERFAAPELAAAVPTVAFRLAAAQALALTDAGAESVVVPELVRASGVARGAGQDPWIVDFPGSLRSALPGVGPVHAVPGWFGAELETRAVEFLQAHGHDLALVRRALDRARPLARPQRSGGPQVPSAPAGATVVAVIAQPWLASPRLDELVRREGETVVGQHRSDPDELRAEGLRAEPRLVDSDAEVLGAARLLGRRAVVDRLRLVVDAESGSDAWLAKRVQRGAHKPLDVVTVQEALAGTDPVDALLRSRLD